MLVIIVRFIVISLDTVDVFALDNVCGIWPVAVSRGEIPGQAVGYGFFAAGAVSFCRSSC